MDAPSTLGRTSDSASAPWVGGEGFRSVEGGVSGVRANGECRDDAERKGGT
ncbi:hypothetical protein GCM10009727_57490 [Actinomadura napierensis]|uniref:AraC family transcriptional regulator n=1 Tax=Actinomadura napierensis TaxID=267854 RepID=A0ABN3A1Q9_9ACTN